MLNHIPRDYSSLLNDDVRAYAYLATTMHDGTPQVTPVWFNVSADHILINTAVGRVKDINMRARPSVAICIADPSDPYRYMQIRGKVEEITTMGADEHIDALSFKYTGRERYERRDTHEQRVTFKIKPYHVDAH